jgi:hypothetical protein
MDLLIDLSNKRLMSTSDVFTRYMIHEIDWSDRLISILGGRGAGKTTLMLQNMKAAYGLSNKDSRARGDGR